MKILHVVPTYIPAWIYGGPILSVHNLCVEQVKSGHDVTVYTTNVNGKNTFKFKDKSEHHCIVNGVKVNYFSCNIRRIYFSISMFFKLCKNLKNFDIVHLHSIFLWPTTCAAILCRKFQVPYIITPRGMLIKSLFKKNFIIKKIWFFFFEKKNIENAKAIQVSTDYEYKEIKKFHYNLRKIFIIPNGVINPRYFRYPKEKKIFLKKKFKNILYIGRVNWKKNIDIIIKAMINLDNFFFTIVGNDEDNYKQKLLNLINKLKIKKRVRIFSERRGHSKEYLLKKCDLFILPSMSENFGNSVLDALKYRKIVAITKGVGIASLIKKYRCGVIIPSDPVKIAYVIKKTFKNEKKLRKIKYNIKSLLQEKFDWCLIIKKTNFMYNYAKVQK